MTNISPTGSFESSLTRDILYAAGYYLGDRRSLFILAAVLIAGGVALNWAWLAAIGVAPILLALLPCAVMCALGLCMQKMKGGVQGDRNTAGGMEAQMVQSDDLRIRIAQAPDLVDPVSQGLLPAATAIASVHRGRIYYFENRANRDAFEAEPDRYLTESEAAGGVASSIAPATAINDASA